MMRWNNSKTYTDEDMRRMQQEAVTRVQEFQNRAQPLPSYYDISDNAIMPYHDPQGYDPTLDYDYPQEETEEFKEIEEYREEAIAPIEEEMPLPPEIPNPFSGMISKLNIDTDTLLILGLIFLLYNEKADNVLLIALGYLLL